MRKMMLPIEVVKHAMVKDGLNPQILDADPNLPAPFLPPPKPRSSSTVAANKTKIDYSKEPKLKDDPIYKKYLTMKKMGLPTGAVQNALQKDGLVDITSFDLELSVKQQVDEKEASGKGGAGGGGGGAIVDKAAKKPKPRRKKLHWNPIDSTKIDKDSVWAQVDVDVDLDLAEFDTLFVAKASPDQKSKKTNVNTKKDKKPSVQVIDGKRGMNGGIALARIRIPHTEIAKVSGPRAKRASHTQL